MYLKEEKNKKVFMENSILLMLSSFFFILNETRLIKPKNEKGMVNSDKCHSGESK